AAANVFEPVVTVLCPTLSDGLQELRERGAWLARMSGSGSVIFGIFFENKQRDEALQHMTAVYEKQGWSFWSASLLPELPPLTISFV
ncbi:MAG TPA: hypothetical protein GX717_02625, partial [Clostridiaceae bacterium]|nr:hypothetical protein [Clostridiaceae bacterium]